MNCPKCNAICDQDGVDIGVGVLYGPLYCTECYWSQAMPSDDPDWHTSPAGHSYRISALVERGERFGIGDLVKDVFSFRSN